MEVQFSHVTKRFGQVEAVSDLNLTIENGALHFLLGPSGCGKTTTLRMLAGLEKPTSGRILFDGRDVTKLAAAERNIGMVFQNYALWPHMTVKANVTYGLKLRKLSVSEIDSRVDDVLEFTQLKQYADRYPGQLSGGQQQRVALARALAIRPSVLLLDEPLSNLDAKLRLEMRDNISRIHKQTGITTVYVTHDQKEALSMGTEITVMHRGKLMQSGSPRELYRSPANSFIAGFIGETNLVPGKIIARRGTDDVVDTSMGKFFAGSRRDVFDIGSEVTLSFRPESVQIRPLKAASSEENSFTVTLDHLTYLGESEQLQLCHAQHRLRANVFNAETSKISDGDRVIMYVAPADVTVLPESQDFGPGT